MKKWLIIVPVLLAAGCSGSLKSSFTNFRAHYNGFYNARKSFEAGLNQVARQKIQLDVASPIQVHPSPTGAGSENFKAAIDKTARVLRKFPDSKWTDDALFLMGRSYFYDRQFYLAEQKFEELFQLSSAPQLDQKAIIWKARTLLELQRYEEGVSYLEDAVNSLVKEQKWYTYLNGEAKVLLGEHYAMLGEWKKSGEELTDAIPMIEENKLKARTYFLQGQVLERLGRFGEAYFAFDQVAPLFPDYEYIYWAEIKKAQVARMEGNFDLAMSIFVSMSRDDKNFERRAKIRYEIARTQEMRGDYRAAERRYRELLQATVNAPSQLLRSEIYFRLGKIYGDRYKNFSVAAAYYDSASVASSSRDALAENAENPQLLADAFGRYVSLKGEEAGADSLLRLGSLSPAELDSAVAAVRIQRLEELREQLGSGQNTLANIDRKVAGTQDAGSTVYGFLNYRNSRLATESRQHFTIVWGDRPLVDNWRLSSQISGTQYGSEETARQEAGGEQQGRVDDSRLGIDLSEIPATEEEKAELRNELITTQYEIGNLFFFTLDRPDSAKVYFRNIAEQYPGHELAPKAMYSLFQIYNRSQQEDSSRIWGERILSNYPGTPYAEQLRRQWGIGEDGERQGGLSDYLRERMEAIDAASYPDSSLAKARRFRNLASANRLSELAPHIYFRSIEEYVNAAQEQSRAPAGDSAGNGSVSEIGLRTAYWDSVRAAVAEYDSLFPDDPLGKKVQALKEALSRMPASGSLPTCEEYGIEPQVAPDMQTFLDGISWPDSLAGSRLSGTISYSFVISRDGAVESFTLLSGQSPPGIRQAYETAFARSLRFAPLQSLEYSGSLRCEVTFPIRN